MTANEVIGVWRPGLSASLLRILTVALNTVLWELRFGAGLRAQRRRSERLSSVFISRDDASDKGMGLNFSFSAGTFRGGFRFWPLLFFFTFFFFFLCPRNLLLLTGQWQAGYHGVVSALSMWGEPHA